MFVKIEPCLHRTERIGRHIGRSKEETNALSVDHPVQVLIRVLKGEFQHTVLYRNFFAGRRRDQVVSDGGFHRLHIREHVRKFDRIAARCVVIISVKTGHAMC